MAFVSQEYCGHYFGRGPNQFINMDCFLSTKDQYCSDVISRELFLRYFESIVLTLILEYCFDVISRELFLRYF